VVVFVIGKEVHIMAAKYLLTCGCGKSSWTISANTSGTKSCPHCKRRIQFSASSTRL